MKSSWSGVSANASKGYGAWKAKKAKGNQNKAWKPKRLNLSVFSNEQYARFKEEYAIYLQSDHWRAMKAKALAHRPYCSDCKGTTGLEVHHKTYERKGKER